MAINLSRNTRLWVSTVNTETGGTPNNSNTFEIPVQEGYSLNQSVSTTDINIDEAGPTPSRGGKRFNTSLDPVEWSFSTYLNPYLATDGTKNYEMMVDMLLWHALASSNSTAVDFHDGTWDDIDFSTPTNTSKVFGNATKFLVDFSNNGAHTLTKLYFYFKIDNDVYLIEDVQIGQAEISVDISDIAMTNWSGNGVKYTRLSAAPTFIASGTGLAFDATAPTSDEFVAIPSGKKYIVNKLTTLSFSSDVNNAGSKSYAVPITGATVTINNNVTYLTPNTLAEVDTPIGSFTGAFEVTGSLDAYMRHVAGADGAGTPYGTTQLLEHMLNNTNKVTNITDITINIGGTTSSNPAVKLLMPEAHIAVPSLSADEAVSTSIEFRALDSSATDLASGGEISIETYSSLA